MEWIDAVVVEFRMLPWKAGLSMLWMLSFMLGSSGAAQQRELRATSSTSFDVMIMGTIVSKDKGKSVALIKEVKTNKVKALKIGYLLLEKYPVLVIAQDHIIVQDLKKRRITLYKDRFSQGSTQGLVVAPKQPAAGSTLRGKKEYREEGLSRTTEGDGIDVALTAAYRDNMVKNDLQKILMEAAATPYMQGGKIGGFQLTDITPGSIFEKAGFENGDVITSINAVPLESPTGAIKVLHSVKGAESVDVTLMRSGQSMDMTISVQ